MHKSPLINGDTLEEARIGSSLTKITALTEKGDTIAGPPDDNQRHDILTGSQTDGRAFTDTLPPGLPQFFQRLHRIADKRKRCAFRYVFWTFRNDHARR